MRGILMSEKFPCCIQNCFNLLFNYLLPTFAYFATIKTFIYTEVYQSSFFNLKYFCMCAMSLFANFYMIRTCRTSNTKTFDPSEIPFILI